MTQYFSKALYIFLMAMIGVACGAPPDQNNNNNNQQNNNTINNNSNNTQSKLGTVKVWLKEGQSVSSSKICFFPLKEMREGQQSRYFLSSVDAKILLSDGYTFDCVDATVGVGNAIQISLPEGSYFLFDYTGKYISRYVIGVRHDEKSTFGLITVKQGQIVGHEVDHGLIIMTNGDLTPDGSWWCADYDTTRGIYRDEPNSKPFGVTFQSGNRDKENLIFKLSGTPFIVGDGNTFQKYPLSEEYASYKGTFDKTGEKEWSFVAYYRFKTDKPDDPDLRAEYRCQPLCWVQIHRWNLDPAILGKECDSYRK